MVSALAKATAVAQSAEALDDQKPVGPGPVKLALQVNGNRREIAVVQLQLSTFWRQFNPLLKAAGPPCRHFRPTANGTFSRR
jgi:hypothetical protein